jgi:hypothetical protein
MTNIQRQLLIVVARKTLLEKAWYRAQSSGERVTLASLYRAGVLQRRAWSGKEGEASAAHEYKLSDTVVESVKGGPNADSV